MKAFNETHKNGIFKAELAIQAGEIADVKYILILKKYKEITVQSLKSEKRPVTKEENVGTKRVLVMPGSGNTKQRTSLSFNFQG